jgi:hypothetical protein
MRDGHAPLAEIEPLLPPPRSSVPGG